MKKEGKNELDELWTEQEERIARTLWKQGVFDEGRTLEEMAKLACMGIGYCPEDQFCESRFYSGEECLCVRQSCPSPAHYEIHQLLRKYYKKQLAKRIFARTVKRQMEPRND